MDGSFWAASITVFGVMVTAVLTAFTALKTGRDKKEREADRRKLDEERRRTAAERRRAEEETTDVILQRVRNELSRAYEILDKRDRQIHRFMSWIEDNRNNFAKLDIDVPDFTEQYQDKPISVGMRLDDPKTQRRKYFDEDDNET